MGEPFDSIVKWIREHQEVVIAIAVVYFILVVLQSYRSPIVIIEK